MPPLVESLLGIRVSTTQVYCRTQAAAQVLPAAALDAPCPAVSAGPESVHGMVDGSMLFSDTGWQEVKVSRVFQQSAPASAPAGETGPSQYVAQRGAFATFTQRFERVLPPDVHAEQVVVTDGAQWTHHWLQAAYPHATHILDVYHVVEKLASAVRAAATPPTWRPAQYVQLWAGQSPAVEQAVVTLLGLAVPLAAQISSCLRTNRARRRYDPFHQRGLLCGSGPVEAAYRTLLQVRFKRSGQCWSNGGLDRLVRLRAALKSLQMHLLTELFKKPTA